MKKINQAKIKLENEETAKLTQKNILYNQLTADMKNINSNREVLKSNEKQWDEFYQNNISSKAIELLEKQNLQNQLLVETKTNYIIKKQTELWNASIVTINNDKILDELENQLETSKKQLAVQPLTGAYLHNVEIVIKAQPQIKNLFDAIVKPTLTEENYCKYSENTFKQAITGNMIM